MPSNARTRGSDLWPAMVGGVAALALYAATLAPGLTWAHEGADGGDLLAAALTRGVPHPSGYPLYEMLLRSVLALPGVATHPARAGNWLSALCAAAAVALLADLARRALPDRPGRGWLAVVAALAWATGPGLWSQAVITEVYTLATLAAVALWWLLWRWRDAAVGRPNRAGGWPWLALWGLALGLGMGDHLSLLLALPGAATWFWGYRRALARAPWWSWPVCASCLAAGLSVYLYLPWAAAGQPPVNWGDAATWPGFWWLITAQPYRALIFGVPLAWLPARASAWAGEALRQFGPWGVALAAWGLWKLDRRDHPWWRLTGLTALLTSLYALGYNSADSYVYLIPTWAAAALWLGEGLSALADAGGRLLQHRAKLQQAPRSLLLPPLASLTAGVAMMALLLIPGASTLAHRQEMDLRGDHEAETFTSQALDGALPGSVILVSGDQPTFALWYAIYGLRERADLIPLNVNLYHYAWYRHTLAVEYPALAPLLAGASDEPDLAGLIRSLAESRAIYRAGPLPLELAGYHERPAGALVQLVPAA